MNREDGMRFRTLISAVVAVLCATLAFLPVARAESCAAVVHSLNRQLSPRIDEQELTDMLDMLNSTGNRRLPPKFLTKKEARELGWSPGRDLWRSSKGSSIGGDRFGNREDRLPRGRWREADLDYKGGHRGGKRLIFSDDGRRFVTVDHYSRFTEVRPCR